MLWFHEIPLQDTALECGVSAVSVVGSCSKEVYHASPTAAVCSSLPYVHSCVVCFN